MSEPMRQPWPELMPDEWPILDRHAWTEANRSAEPLRKGGLATKYAPATRRTMQSLYGGLLYWSRKSGDLDPQAGPADRLTFDIYTAYIAARRSTCPPNTVYQNAGMVVLMMRCLAPVEDWRWLRQHPDLPTKQEALASRRPVREVDSRLMFQGLMQRLKSVVLETPGLDSSLRLRDLLLVAMCTCTALRVSNLRSPILGSTLHRDGHGFELRYQSASIKNRKQVTLSLAQDLTPYLAAYIARFRPVILHTKPVSAEDHQTLWLSRNGRRLDNQAVANIFKRVTVEVQGWPANPHSFRHSAATALLRLDLGLLDVAANLLAHHNQSTVATHYDLSANQSAQRKWSELLGRYSK